MAMPAKEADANPSEISQRQTHQTDSHHTRGTWELVVRSTCHNCVASIEAHRITVGAQSEVFQAPFAGPSRQNGPVPDRMDGTNSGCQRLGLVDSCNRDNTSYLPPQTQ